MIKTRIKKTFIGCSHGEWGCYKHGCKPTVILCNEPIYEKESIEYDTSKLNIKNPYWWANKNDKGDIWRIWGDEFAARMTNDNYIPIKISAAENQDIASDDDFICIYDFNKEIITDVWGSYTQLYLATGNTIDLIDDTIIYLKVKIEEYVE